MGKYNSYSPTPPPSPRQMGIHPAWYVAGVFIMLLTPLLAYAMAELLFQYPNALPQVTRLLYNATDLYVKPGQIFAFAGKLFYLKMIVTLCITLVFYALFAFITFAINSMFGASRYGPYDLPPVSKPKGTTIRKAR